MKKKRRYERKKHKRSNVNRKWDKHHIFFPRREYQKGSANRLRRHWYCIVQIPKDTLHGEIHHLVTGVPIPKKVCVDSILFQLNLLAEYGAIHDDDPIDKRLKVLIALTECSEQETCEALKKQLEIVDRLKQPSA